MTEYEQLKQRLARGWNTWNTRSVLSHVLLPEGIAVNLGLKEYRDGFYLKEALIGRQGDNEEQIHPGPHAYDGSYTEMTLTWRGIEVLVQSATEGDDLVLLITPKRNQLKPAVLVAEAGLLWNRPGTLGREGDVLTIHGHTRSVSVFGTQHSVFEPQVVTQTPYLALTLEGPVGLSTGRARNLAQIEAVVNRRRAEQEAPSAHYGPLAEVYDAVQTVLAWDTIYEPAHDRVVSTVSRIWNSAGGGYMLFCWDTYFAAYMAALDNKDLAYANAIEITRERTEEGFVPNYAWGCGIKSRDRSQPPVGSFVVRELFRRFGDRWLLEMLFDDLLAWNRWWDGHRVHDGLLCWGSNPYEPHQGNYWESEGVNGRFGAALESGLDNSPMYDDIPFDAHTHLMQMQDVGLNGLYVMDCDALADIAATLGRIPEASELRSRADAISGQFHRLWSEDAGIFLNRRPDTGAFSPRLSPTNFYALLGRAATQAQAARMAAEHFYNPAEFWGDWIMPSISRSDPAYPDQSYWRGRIWAPMNFLVYLGLRRYDLPQARADLSARSQALLLKEWREHGHVHENYSGDTGEGCDKPNSDRFYHWGGLLGTIALIEAGHYAGPEQPLRD